MDLGPCHRLSLVLFIACAQKRIIGADFLSKHHLLINLKCCQLPYNFTSFYVLDPVLTVMDYYIPQSVRSLCRSVRKHGTKAPEAESMFALVDKQLSESTNLGHLIVSNATQIALKTDTAQGTVGTVIQQIIDGQIQPLFFILRKATSFKTGCSTFDRELLVLGSLTL
nr:gag pol polyprotein [Hymenolepis microstoma]